MICKRKDIKLNWIELNWIGAFGAVYYNFGAESAFFFNQFWRLSALFKVPKALFIINFGAEGALYVKGAL